MRDALWWCLPALAAGLVFRALLVWYSPYAYFGSDSRSYIGFAHDFLTSGRISLYDKRRFLYPIFLLPVCALPGSPLRWLALIQPIIGLATVIPLGYAVRKVFRHWRVAIVPATLFYSIMPLVPWYEHELLGETFFFCGMIWAFAGWVAWVSARGSPRAGKLFWLFVAGLGLFILTKPSGRFLLPGLSVALLAAKAWRDLAWRHWLGLAGVIALSMFAGNRGQAAWLLYVSSFPLTCLETPLHAAYKAEIRDKVGPLRERIDTYYRLDEGPFEFLDNPETEPGRPLWAALADDDKLRARVYADLAIAGTQARPDLFLYIAAQKMVVSLNFADFKSDRFATEYYPRKFESIWEQQAKKRPDYLRFLFGLPKDRPLPGYGEVTGWLSPVPDTGVARWLVAYSRGFARVFEMFREPEELPADERTIWRYHPTVFAFWLLAGLVLSAAPRYRRTLGQWVLMLASYSVGVFLVGSDGLRYFAPAWPVLFLFAAVPVDMLFSSVGRGE